MTLMALNYLVIFTFVATLIVVCLRSVIDKVWSGTFMVFYNLISFVAFSANLALMLIEVKETGYWSWANYSFWWLALAAETFLAWYHFDRLVVHHLNGTINFALLCAIIF